MAASNASAAHDAAVAALNASAEARVEAEGASQSLTELLERIEAASNGEVTTKTDIETLVNLTMALTIGQVSILFDFITLFIQFIFFCL